MKLGVMFFLTQLILQSIQNQLIVWALITAASISTVSWAWVSVKRPCGVCVSNDWLPSLRPIAVATIAVGYLTLAIGGEVFKVDCRFWVLGAAPAGRPPGRDGGPLPDPSGPGSPWWRSGRWRPIWRVSRNLHRWGWRLEAGHEPGLPI